MTATTLSGAIFLALLLLAEGCDPLPPRPSSPPTTTATVAPVATVATAAPPRTAPPATTARTGTRSRPPIEGACKADTDCVVTATTTEGKFACCSGCEWHAGSKNWLQRFDAACQATPAPMCPPIGCAMPIVKPTCAAGVCVTTTDSTGGF